MEKGVEDERRKNRANHQEAKSERGQTVFYFSATDEHGFEVGGH